MRALLTFPTSQQLRFINRTEEATTKPSFINRLYNHYIPKGIVHQRYCQLVEQTDPLIIQFRTSYTSFDMNIVKQSGYVKTSYSGQEVEIHSYTEEDGTVMKVYNVTIDVTGLTGEYFFTLDTTTGGLPANTFWSEPFDVQAEHEDTMVLRYGGNTGINDKMRWGEESYTIDTYQQNRINSRILKPTFGINKSTYNDSDNELTNLNAYPNATDELEIREAPYYIIEKINLALGHDEFYVDDLLYNTDDELDLSMWEKKQMGSGKIPLRRVEYETSQDDELTGDPPIPVSIARTTGIVNRTTGIVNRTINI